MKCESVEVEVRLHTQQSQRALHRAGVRRTHNHSERLHARRKLVAMSTADQMREIITCWLDAEKRAKHLCAFETLGLSGGRWRCRKPNQNDVKKAWHQLCLRLHPDKHSDGELATEATRCINLAKQYLFEVHFGCAASRVSFFHDTEAKAQNRAAAKEAEERLNGHTNAAASEGKSASAPEGADQGAHLGKKRPKPEDGCEDEPQQNDEQEREAGAPPHGADGTESPAQKRPCAFVSGERIVLTM